MEIRELAETILFATSMKEKLLMPEVITDEHPGKPMAAPETPSRPTGLGFREKREERIAFPKQGELDADEKRGQVLHFFANHELLALELMALALLKFPDAPARFRRILVTTIADEQRHMGLYMERMHALGVELGEVPMSGLFWRMISNMEVPLDFVSRMSLTFEQANLDFSLHYRDLFQLIGDQVSAKIMQDVLIDEVSHVAHGVHYFEQWREGNGTFWDDYASSLPYPMTPARAKGIGFTRKHRIDAGLGDAYIERLEVYSHSKGRKPRVLLFNPSTERALGLMDACHEKGQAALDMTRDLETLPMFLCGKEDVVLVRKQPRTAFLQTLHKMGFETPEFSVADLDGPQIPHDHPLCSRSLQSVEPWGWDPVSAKFLSPLSSDDEGEPYQERMARWRPFASKRWFAERWEEWLSGLHEPIRKQLLTEPSPVIVDDMEGLEEALGRFHGLGYEECVAKAPFGTSGRDARRLKSGGVDAALSSWAQRLLRSQGSLVVEPWFDRIMDLSVLFEIVPGGQVKHRGYTRFFTTSGGQYRGTLLAPFQDSISDELRAFLLREEEGVRWFHEMTQHLLDKLAVYLRKDAFVGKAGIDMMLVRTRDGAIRLRAPLELNPRATMGHVSQTIRRRVANEARGVFLFVGEKELSLSSCQDFPGFVDKMENALAYRVGNDGRSMAQGVMPLTDPQCASKVMAICLAAESVAHLDHVLTQAGLPALG